MKSTTGRLISPKLTAFIQLGTETTVSNFGIKGQSSMSRGITDAGNGADCEDIQ